MAAVDGVGTSDAGRWSRLPEGTTYEQWKAGKAAASGKASEASHHKGLTPKVEHAGISKAITLDDVADAIYYTEINEDVGKKIFDVLRSNENINTHFFESVVVRNTPRGADGLVYMSTEVVVTRSGSLSRLVLNEAALGGKTVEEINGEFAASKRTVCNSLEEAVVHEIGHAKTYHGRTRDEIEALFNAIENKRISGVSPLAYSDGAECLAEVEVLLWRGDDVHKEAMELYNQYVLRRTC